MKFPSERGTICTVKADQKTTRQCYVAGLKFTSYASKREPRRPETIVVDLDPRTNTDDRIQPQGDVKSLVLGRTKTQTTTSGANLEPGDKHKLVELLKTNVDLFAWSVDEG